MVICAVATCNARSGRDPVNFFRFPQNKELRHAWIFKCRRKNFCPSKYARVCSQHFVESDFAISQSFASSVGYGNKLHMRLKPDAIPSIIPEPKGADKRKSPRKSKAQEKRNRLKVCALKTN